MWIALFIIFLVLLIYGIYHVHVKPVDDDKNIITDNENKIPFNRLDAHERAIVFLERNRGKNNYSKHI